MTDLTPNEIDILMDLDPVGLSDQHLDKIIATHRKWRADYQAGVKPKKTSGQKQTLDIGSLIQNITKDTDGPKVTPSTSGGMRR